MFEMLSGGAGCSQTNCTLGYPQDTTEKMAVKGFNWTITRCITPFVSASLMVHVVFFFGWQNAGESGRVLFIIGTMIEVGFDIYDWLEQFLIAFCHSSFKS